MITLRRFLVAVVAVAAFAAAFAITRAQTRPDTAATVAGISRSPTPRNAARAERPSPPLATPAGQPLPLLRVHERPPTPYEQIVLSQPEAFHTMQRPLQRALEADKQRTRPCFADTEIVGEVTIEFSWRVESTAAHAVASQLRFVEIHDGVAISDASVRCLEESLSATYEALADDGRPFPSFAGEVPVRLSWGVHSPSRHDGR